MSDEEEPVFEVVGAEGAVPNDDGTQIKLSLLMRNGQHCNLAIPAAELPPLLAMISQVAGQAQAIAGNVYDQEILEADAAEVYQDDQTVVLHFRLSGGLDLAIALSPRSATDLRDRLSASLAQGLSIPSGKIPH